MAGPYHAVRDVHDGIELGVFCRRSLAEFLDPGEILAVTRQGFDFFHRAFDYRYAFDKYDQLFVPEFNAGAMENAGCVTFLEDYVFRSKVTDARRERRAETILHEMAHMWFGDLVTMQWWDDLWLNESFATYASVLAQVSCHPLEERVDHFRQRREDLGLPAGPAAHDPSHRGRRDRHGGRQDQLRRDHLREGRLGAQATRRVGRSGGVPHRAALVLPLP